MNSFIRTPDRCLATLRAGARNLDAYGHGLRAWLALGLERNLPEAKEQAERGLKKRGDTRFATAALVEVLIHEKQFRQAVAVLAAERERRPEILWYDLSLSDLLMETKRLDEARVLLKKACDKPMLRRHAIKRLAGMAAASGDDTGTRTLLTQLVAMEPEYFVYASDYVRLARLHLAAGDKHNAHKVILAGRQIYKRNALLGQLIRDEGLTEPANKPAVQALDERRFGARRLPIRTPIISVRTDLPALLREVTAPHRCEGDVLAISESALAAAQGRAIPLELINVSPLANALRNFVTKGGPIGSPQGMQGAVLAAGAPRVLAGAVAGLAGRLCGIRGLFYRVAGEQVAMIDDAAACLPPMDHHVIFGPFTPDSTAQRLADQLGLQVAIVDANHVSGARVVGRSAGIDSAWVEQALSDNPAGNEDEQTPIVLIRRVTA